MAAPVSGARKPERHRGLSLAFSLADSSPSGRKESHLLLNTLQNSTTVFPGNLTFTSLQYRATFVPGSVTHLKLPPQCMMSSSALWKEPQLTLLQVHTSLSYYVMCFFGVKCEASLVLMPPWSAVHFWVQRKYIPFLK